MTTTYTVSSEGATFGNTVTTTLNGAIRTLDTGPVDNYIINLSVGFTLTADLLAINVQIIPGPPEKPRQRRPAKRRAVKRRAVKRRATQRRRRPATRRAARKKK